MQRLMESTLQIFNGPIERCTKLVGNQSPGAQNVANVRYPRSLRESIFPIGENGLP